MFRQLYGRTDLNRVKHVLQLRVRGGRPIRRQSVFKGGGGGGDRPAAQQRQTQILQPIQQTRAGARRAPARVIHGLQGHDRVHGGNRLGRPRRRRRRRRAVMVGRRDRRRRRAEAPRRRATRASWARARCGLAGVGDFHRSPFTVAAILAGAHVSEVKSHLKTQNAETFLPQARQIVPAYAGQRRK